jgi:16S rRNA (guanine966-N2)-methyltransferase
MRVIAGKFRSRILKSLKGRALRPTSDRLRETLFDVLGGLADGSRFLDLFAGTGAVGIEALSRGAEKAVFVESHLPAVKLIGQNLAALGITSEAEVFAGDALKTLEKLAARDAAFIHYFDLAFLDPPYADEVAYRSVLSVLAEARLLTQGAIVIVEHSSKRELKPFVGRLRQYRVLRQGDATLTFYRYQGAPAEPRDG